MANISHFTQTVNGVSTTYDIHDANAVDLTNNQTVAGNKEFTGTTTAHDVIPSATDTYNFGSSSYQWNNAYIKSLTINGVVCGDILTHNASEFVGVTGDQTIGGKKIFSHIQTGMGRDSYHFATSPYGKNSPPANTSYQYVWFSGNTASQGFANSWYGGYLEQRIYTNGSAHGKWSVQDTSENIVGIELFVNGNDRQFRPQGNNITDLGTSANKWKTFNGINPGALSLPNAGIGCVDIRSTVGQYLKDNNTNIYEFTAQFDGWVCVGIIKGSLRIDNNTTNVSSGCEDLGWWQSCIIPFMKNDSIKIKINKMDPADDYVNNIIWKAFIYPCQGNV